MKVINTIVLLLSSFIAVTGQLKMNSNSNVGIGTLTPQKLLHIKDGDFSLQNGKAGINLLNPTYELDVDGVIRFNGVENNTDLIWDRTTARLLIASGNPSNDEAEARLHIKAFTTSVPALFLQDVGTSTAGVAVAKIMGKRSDGNKSPTFSGQVALSRHYSSSFIKNNMVLGRILFGGNHTDGDYLNTKYSASIYAIADEDFTDSDDMQTSLYFQTDTSGISENTANSAGYLNTKMVIEGSGEVGIGTTSPSYLLEVNGDAAKPGGGSWTSASDKRLKNNIKDFEDGLEKVLKIHPVLYHYNGQANLPANKEFVGVVAQEIQEVAPYMVETFKYKDKEKSTTDEYLGVDDTAIKYILVNAIKELNKRVEVLEAKLEVYENNPVNHPVNQKEITLSGDTGFFLGQNIPNPYENETTIPYEITASGSDAMIRIYNLSGQLLKSIDLDPGKWN